MKHNGMLTPAIPAVLPLDRHMPGFLHSLFSAGASAA